MSRLTSEIVPDIQQATELDTPSRLVDCGGVVLRAYCANGQCVAVGYMEGSEQLTLADSEQPALDLTVQG